MNFKNFFFILNLFFFILTETPEKIFAEEKNFSVTCSLFPVYDFTREIAGDFADIHLLLKPGAEPHEFEPTPLDIKILNNSDVFIFTNASMEEWAKKISLSLKNVHVVDASEGVEIFNNDPHIWLDLDNAQKMVMNIVGKLSETKPELSEIFMRNAEDYCGKLKELDKKFSGLNKKTLVFAGEFAFGYFVRRYGFDFISAYDGENEPSLKKMAEILKFINENRIKFIFAESFGLSAITRSIAEQTGAEILFFDSGEKIPQENFTFFKLMQSNYEALKKFIDE